jgi:Poly-beta-hydroxybutyrate polymerase (PhaC) N-terminus
LKQSYLLSSKQLSEFVDHAQIDDKSRLQLRFYARQFIDAMSPSKTCNQTVMSDGIMISFVDFTAFSFKFDRFRCGLV